jgi:NADH-quinone oxidoreductase subunit C
MSTRTEVVATTPEQWLAVCSDYADQGVDVVDWLTAVDREVGLEVVVCLVNPGSGAAVLVSCTVDADVPRIQSLSGRFPGADWHERETAEMFGVEFIGRESIERLLLRQPDRTPLRKSSPLGARVDVPWPGSDDDAGRRRRKLPPGVRAEWVTDDQ